MNKFKQRLTSQIIEREKIWSLLTMVMAPTPDLVWNCEDRDGLGRTGGGDLDMAECKLFFV